MSKNVNRYTLVLEGNIEKKRLFSRSLRVEIVYEDIRKYNSKKSNPYFIGDLKFNGHTRTLYYKRYTKLTNASTLQKIDEMTTKLENENSLKVLLNLKDKNKIYIAYRANKRIRLLDVFYKYDIDYLNEYFLEDKIIEYYNNVNFLNSILSNKLIKSNIHSKDQYDLLCGLLSDKSFISVSNVLAFYHAFINPEGYRRYFNQRYIANIVRVFERKLPKVEEVNNLKEIEGQLVISSYYVGEFKDYYESYKIGEMTREELVKKLIK